MNNEKINFLQSYYSIDRRVSYILQGLETINLFAGFTSNPTTKKKLINLIEQDQQKITQLQETKKEIERAINGLKSDTYRELLTHRYIEGMSWKEVAATMFYSDRSVFAMHKRALAKLYI